MDDSRKLRPRDLSIKTHKNLSTFYLLCYSPPSPTVASRVFLRSEMEFMIQELFSLCKGSQRTSVFSNILKEVKKVISSIDIIFHSSTTYKAANEVVIKNITAVFSFTNDKEKENKWIEVKEPCYSATGIIFCVNSRRRRMSSSVIKFLH